jgi:hypothetical protein
MADFFAPGAIELYFLSRDNASQTSGWRFLGTAVTAPEIEAQIISTPFTSDLLGPTPFQDIFNNEIHKVTAVINRLNFNNWRYMRMMYESGQNVRSFSPTVSSSDSTANRRGIGQPMLHNLDCTLLLKSAAASNTDLVTPVGVTKSRRYFSVILKDYHETTINSRVQEVSVVFECHPYLTITELPPLNSAGATRRIKPTSLSFKLYEDNVTTTTTPE